MNAHKRRGIRAADTGAHGKVPLKMRYFLFCFVARFATAATNSRLVSTDDRGMSRITKEVCILFCRLEDGALVFEGRGARCHRRDECETEMGKKSVASARR